MENNWQNEISSILQTEFQIEKVYNYLSVLKNSGISQTEVRECLTQLRAKAENDTIEDSVLELLDVVEGFCNIKYRVW